MFRESAALIIIFLALAGCASRPEDGPVPEEAHPDASLENYGPAPELTNEIWLNTEQPLRLEDMRGKVVLLEMWTFG